jgi:hypothetical protein
MNSVILLAGLLLASLPLRRCGAPG